MKITLLFAIVIGSVLGVRAAYNSVIDDRTRAGGDPLLALAAQKNSYVLGEPVPLKIEFVNDSTDPIKLGNCFDVATGDIHVFVSQDGKTFKKYSHSKWGISDTVCHATIQPQQRLGQAVSLLWNFVPEVADVDQLANEQLVTNYVFPEKGTYSIKASYLANLSGKLVAMTSNAIDITVTEPTGDDRKVWEKIKDRPDLGYFIQEGDFLTYDVEKRKKLRNEMEELVDQYPDSKILESSESHLRTFHP